MSYYQLNPGLTPEGYARRLMHQLAVNSFPVDARKLAIECGIVYRESDFKGITTFDGCLIRKGQKSIVIINKSIAHSGRRNFSTGHELGHFAIPHHNDLEYVCYGRDLLSFNTQKPHEDEANRFAAELLMPEQEVSKRVRRAPFSLEQVEELSVYFGTSLTAAALRLVKLTTDKCAVVVSADGQILWSYRSKRFPYELRGKGPLADETYAIDYFKGLTVPKGPQRLGPHGWITTPGVPVDADIIEHSIPFSNLGLVLTLLIVPERDDEDLDEDSW